MIWVGDRDVGSIVPEQEALIGVLDRGFTVGEGVFETLKVVDGRAFAVTRHLQRLSRSARILGLPEPVDEVVRDAVDEVLFANAPLLGAFARLRVTYTAGSVQSHGAAGSALPSLVVSVAPAGPWPATTSVVTVPWTRNERSPLAGAKCTSYAESVIALRYARERGASEGVLANTRGQLCEGTASNVFVVIDSAVVTPPLSSGCLPGVTRELVLEWFGAHEKDLPLDALQTADEVFVTSSTRDVHPVVTADERTWPAVGPVAKALHDEFASRARRDLDP